jgi:hypothetical protein
MANQVIPRLTGDDYQHLFSWYYVLALLRPSDYVKRVRVEDEDAGSVDDVTVLKEIPVGNYVEISHFFYQVKYHDSQFGHYSGNALLEGAENRKSLLQKFWRTWKLLRDTGPSRRIELHLVSNWSWNQDADHIGKCISGQDDSLTNDFFESSPASAIGKERERWREHLVANPPEFVEFVKPLRFSLGDGSFRQLKDRVAERMEHLQLDHDENALAISSVIIRDWIRTKRGDIDLNILQKILNERRLHSSGPAEPCATVYLNTIAERIFNPRPDFVLDWRKYFVGSPDKKGHIVQDPTSWDAMMLPELRSVANQISSTTSARLIRARGLSRLSAWFAFGFVFSEVAGYAIEVQQQEHLWRTDAPSSQDFALSVTEESLSESRENGTNVIVACGISVSGPLDEDVRKHVATMPGRIAALQLIRSERELGRACLRDAGDAVALARAVKSHMRDFVKRWNATRLILYYFGPLSGACFIAHQLNAVCREVQIMEDQQPGYAESFTLR